MNRAKQRTPWVLPILCFLGVSLPACFAQVAAVPQKQLIEFGWDSPAPQFMHDYIREMQTRPFDGLIWKLPDYYWAFDTRVLGEDVLSSQIELLDAINWGTLRSNFLLLWATNRFGMDWFDHKQWNVVLANLQSYAKAAVSGRCVGIAFDPEPYGPNPWIYEGNYRDLSLDKVSAQVAERGFQFITTIQRAMPHVLFLVFFEPARPWANATVFHDYALLPPFLEGIKRGLAKGNSIIDGNEPSFYFEGKRDYDYAQNQSRRKMLRLNDSKMQVGYPTTQVGMAVFVDHCYGLRVPKEDFISTYLSPDQREKWLEHNVFWALETADEYVWCYSQRIDWWKGKIPDGIEDAIRSARKKVANSRPLGFDIEDSIQEAKKKTAR